MIKYVVLIVSLFVSMLLPVATVEADTNLLLNPSVEDVSTTSSSPVGWTANSWGNNVVTKTYETGGYTGNKSLSLSMTSRSSGDAKWMHSAVTVTPNTTYTYTSYYKSNITTEIDLQYTSTSGNVSYVYIKSIPVSADWSKLSATFTTPSDASKVVVLHLIAAIGTLQTDEFSLAANSPIPEVPPVATGNLVLNSSFEQANGTKPANWTEGNWGTNSASFTYMNEGHTGTKSAKVVMSSYVNGDAKWAADAITVTPNTVYNYTDYYKANIETALVAAYTLTTGAQSYIELGTAPVATTWSKYSVNYTVPQNATKVTIYHIIRSVGTLTIDDVSNMLVNDTQVPPVTPPSSNIVENYSFEAATGTTPTAWEKGNWGTNSASFTYMNEGHTGTKSAKVEVTNYQSGDAKWYFQPISSLEGGKDYKINIWYKTNIQPHVVAMFTDAQGVDSFSTLETPSPALNSSTTWQQYTTTFSTPQNMVTATVFMLVSSKGWVQTDDYVIEPYTPVGFNRGIVSLTFDDGWKSIYTNGLPILQKYGLPSTQYLISDLLNTPGYMTTADVKAFLNQGSEIGSHTQTHSDLTALNSSQLTSELQNSQSKLRSLFGQNVAIDFASPEGLYNQTVVTAVQKYYQSHRSVDVGYNSKDSLNLYRIKVQNISKYTTTEQLIGWVNKAKLDRTWLVLVYHQVDTGSSVNYDYTVTPDNFDAQLAAIKSSGITVETMSQAISEVTSQ